jgi:glycerophosphoryl diester phosphodiesterase
MSIPIIVAHRGLHRVHTENSLPAFTAAWDAGICWCECDVHATADGAPVVIHDATLDRTTDRREAVNEVSFASIQGVVPSLRQVLTTMPPRRGILIEIKPEDGELVRRVIDEAAGHQCIIQSFHPRNLRWAAQRRSPPAALLVERNEEVIDAANGPWDWVNVEQKLLDSPEIARIRGEGKKLGVWTVNTPDEMKRAMERGAEMMITDEPLLAMTLCSGRSD